MSPLNRKDLSNGNYLNSFHKTPGFNWWSEEQIKMSMHATLAQRPSSQPVWLFAYGSLIWNPQCHYVESVPALLDGWRRSFCMKLIAGRATLEQPGRMLSLSPAGKTQGFALRFDEDNLEEELLMVWRREMVAGSYQPDWAELNLHDGRKAKAIIFRADPQGQLHEHDDSINTVSPIIAKANGILGSNIDYVMQLDDTLKKHNFSDDYVAQLAHQLRSAS
ncbi:MAG: gamma-glutamylcyclotransferase [Alcaligenaceae bacterium]|nr:gamma-glutamylcyclotransferase [Alcaligenaceae bacterium]